MNVYIIFKRNKRKVYEYNAAIIYMPLVFPFSSLFCLCHNLCGPGKTALLLRVLWAEREYRAEGVIDVSLDYVGMT